MKIALCTTTINVPHVLKLYRTADVQMFVAGDQKTPAEAYREFGFSFLDPEGLKTWKCHDLIGPNSIQRRNLAFLEALKWGADVIVSIDDDNIPMGNYFFHHRYTFASVFSGVMVNNTNQDNDWFDVGSLLIPPARHRGIPVGYAPRTNHFTHAVGANIGVNAGICLGDPDIDATTRIALAPEVHQVSQLLQVGIVNNPHTWTVFNSQNTAVLRELIPAWGMIPFVGRFDDIYASLICQRVMRERNLHVHFGHPFVWQQRNDHDLVKDLRGEIDGYENVAKLASTLDRIVLAGCNVIDDCRTIWETLNYADWMPTRSTQAMLAWLDDCENVLEKVPA